MTTEEDFRAALDDESSDWQTRLVFADWLDERGDPRAAGYRALGTIRRRPRYFSKQAQWYSERGASGNDPESDLPDDWYQLLTGGTQVGYRHWPTMNEAEDAAALAFTKLPAARQAELLTAISLAPNIEPPKKRSRRKPRATEGGS